MKLGLKKARPAVCWGPGADQNRKGCRPARPLCRWMRRRKPSMQRCGCDAYHYPHRSGSGRCGNPEAMALYVLGPCREGEAA